METAFALVLGCDLTPDGFNLGPQTIVRLERALEHAQETGERLVVSASWSPRHAQQPVTMARMMANWLKSRGCAESVIVVHEATLFNTRGELMAVPEANSIISDELHLKRVRILVRRLYGRRKSRSINYIPTAKSVMTTKGRMLEPLKCAFLFLPFWFQDGVIYLLHHTVLRKINLSY